MSDNEICYMSATELSKNYRDKTLSPVEVIKALISRAESINSKLNAFTYTFYEEALDNAKKAEEKFLSKNGNPRLLEGIPVGIKDESGLKGKPMSPTGDKWEKALGYWNTLKTDTEASPVTVSLAASPLANNTYSFVLSRCTSR